MDAELSAAMGFDTVDAIKLLLMYLYEIKMARLRWILRFKDGNIYPDGTNFW